MNLETQFSFDGEDFSLSTVVNLNQEYVTLSTSGISSEFPVSQDFQHAALASPFEHFVSQLTLDRLSFGPESKRLSNTRLPPLNSCSTGPHPIMPW